MKIIEENSPIDQAELTAAWVEFLSRYNFNWFCTLTFRASDGDPHPETAYKRFQYWVTLLNQELYGRQWRRHANGGVYWVVALEYQKSGIIHFHALLGDYIDLNTRVKRLYFMDLWDKLAGYAKIEEIQNTDLVTNYIAKYTAKGGQIDVSKNLKDYAVQASACLHAARR